MRGPAPKSRSPRPITIGLPKWLVHRSLFTEQRGSHHHRGNHVGVRWGRAG